MKNEAAFSQWLTKQIKALTKNKAICQRIETVTSNGVPDLTVILEDTTLFIETKFETTKLRPEQNAWAYKFHYLAPFNAECIAIAAYPKSKRLIDIHENKEYPLTKGGVTDLLVEYGAIIPL